MQLQFVQYLASAETAAPKAAGTGSSVFSSLGIDWKALIFQLIAFTLLVWLMSKYIFPVLIKAVDKRQEANEAGARAALEAEKNAVKAEAEVEVLLKKARSAASDIVATAKAEAGDIVQRAEEKSRTHAERIVAEARDSIGKEVLSAKKSLHNEMIDLVTAATEKVTSRAVTQSVNAKIIADAVKESR